MGFDPLSLWFPVVEEAERALLPPIDDDVAYNPAIWEPEVVLIEVCSN